MEFRTPWDPLPAPAAPLPVAGSTPPRRRGRRPAPMPASDAPWLYHQLTVSGSADAVTAFAAAARGAGVVPWRVDSARIEEDIFNLAASQPKAMRSLTIEGCRILARQFRERVEARAAQAAARVGRNRDSPFDLHSLLPVPPGVLELGPDHPEARVWLAAHWGLTDSPRQVAERPGATAGRRLPSGHAVVGYSFFTAQETPQVAMAELGRRWPAVRFDLQPRPLD